MAERSRPCGADPPWPHVKRPARLVKFWRYQQGGQALSNAAIISFTAVIRALA